jgi:hypothetical protein
VITGNVAVRRRQIERVLFDLHTRFLSTPHDLRGIQGLYLAIQMALILLLPA